MRERVGYEIAHSMIDDHSRLAYTELHRDERAKTVVGFVERAIAFFRSHGIEPKRLQTDNAWTYVRNRALAELLAREDVSHRTIPARMPKRNGKVERYQRPSSASGASGSATAPHATGPRRCHTGSTTTTTPDATARSPAFGTS